MASDPTVPRLVDALADDVDRALSAIETARAAARARMWALAGDHAPDHGRSATTPMVIDLDATLVPSHSDKEDARATFKRGYGSTRWARSSTTAPAGTGELVHLMLRPGNAGSNTAADRIAVTRKALAQLPGYSPGVRPRRKVPIRTDGEGATHAFLDWLDQPVVVLDRVHPGRHHRGARGDAGAGVDTGLHR